MIKTLSLGLLLIVGQIRVVVGDVARLSNLRFPLYIVSVSIKYLYL